MQLDHPGHKRLALAVSLGLHVAGFFGLMYAPPISLPSLPPPSPSEYQQAFAGKEDRIVWYRFRELPDIAPQDSPSASHPLRADVKAKQAIVSSPKNAPKLDRVVVAPIPAVELPPLDLPNLIAVKLPPKQFTTPPDVVRPAPAKIELPDVPQVPVQPLDSANLPADRLPARPYIPPQLAPKSVRTVANVDIVSDVNQTQPPLITKLPAIRLPTRAYVPPPSEKVPERRRIAAATEVQTETTPAPAATVLPNVKLPARAYIPPPPPAPPSAPRIEAPAGDVTIAIAGLNPSAMPVKLPAASSPAQFSAGETVRPDGATSDGAGKGITAPDLYAHAAKPDLPAMSYVAPTASQLLDDSLRRRLTGAPILSVLATPHAEATRVSNAPDRRFNGRDVYMMAIQMPNLTSYSGSWLMWYADRAARESGAPPIAAPVPHRKVDPKYTPSAQDDHVEGRVQLFCVIGREGNVSSIELLRGVDDRLNHSAEEALSKWEFYPATRNGQPVDVDVVVEIPFVLAPPPLK